VRVASAGEEFKALDGRVYKLLAHQIVIGDAAAAAAPRRVMAARIQASPHHHIHHSRERIFQPSLIRRTSARRP